MFVIAKHKLSSQTVFQRIPSHDAARMKDKGIAVFEDERMAEYAACYVNLIEFENWTQDVNKHGRFEYDIKYKKDLYIAHDHADFTRRWVAFMFTDVSYQLRTRGIDGGRFFISSCPNDVPLTPWVIIKLNTDSYFLVSASDGRVVGSNDQEAVGSFSELINNVGGVLCGAHLEVLTLQEVI